MLCCKPVAVMGNPLISKVCLVENHTLGLKRKGHEIMNIFKFDP